MLNHCIIACLSIILSVSCNNDIAIADKENLNPISLVNFTEKKSINITISKCDFDKIGPLSNTIYSSSI
jgi:hypothetical protein